MNHIHDSQETTPQREAWIKLCQCIGNDNAWAIGNWVKAVIADEREAAKPEPPKPDPGAGINDAAALRRLVSHCWVHSGYPDCGYDQMDSKMKSLYDALRGREPDADEKPEPGDVPEWIRQAFFDAWFDAGGKTISFEQTWAGARKLNSEITRRVAEATAKRDKRIAELETEVKRAIVGRNMHCGDANAKAIEITKLKQQLATKDAEIERLKASHSDLVTDMRRQVVNLQAELAECRKPVEEVLCKDLAFFAACADQHWQYLTAKWHRNAIEGIQRERNARVAAERERGELREAWKRIRVLYRHGRKDMCYEIRIDEECLTDDDIESLLAAFAAYRAEKAKVQG